MWRGIFRRHYQYLLNMKLIALDTETTGLYPSAHHIVELGLSTHTGKRRSYLMKPPIPIPAAVSAIHHIDDSMVANCPTFAEVWAKVETRIQQADFIVGHNIAFDVRFISAEVLRAGLPRTRRPPSICTMEISKAVYGRDVTHKLCDLAQRLELSSEGQSHRADADADLSMRCLLKMMELGLVEITEDGWQVKSV